MVVDIDHHLWMGCRFVFPGNVAPLHDMVYGTSHSSSFRRSRYWDISGIGSVALFAPSSDAIWLVGIGQLCKLGFSI
jgi:hypothetical protein